VCVILIRVCVICVPARVCVCVIVCMEFNKVWCVRESSVCVW
jgi:hypothetical protein